MDVRQYIDQLKIRSQKVIKNKLDFLNQKLLEITNKYILKNPISIYQVKEQQFDYILDKLKYNIQNLYHLKEKELMKIKSSYILKNPEKLLDTKKNKYLQAISKLDALSPLATIKRGYSIVKKEDRVITSIKNIKKKDEISLELSDGIIHAEVL